MTKLPLASVFFIVLPLLALAQVTYTAIPMDSALVARNLVTNKGTINISGQVNNAGTPYDSLCLKLYRNAIPVDSIYCNLVYVGNHAPFTFSCQIPAELDEYMIRIYGIKNKVNTLDTAIYALLAGDVFIIEGQSNAFGEMRDGGSASANNSEFIRSFATPDSSVAGFLTYLKWGIGEPDGGLKEHGHVGQWGIRLARLLVDSIKIPIAIFNGACGGTPISYYERPANYKVSLNSNYAREYYRLTLTGLQNNVRAVIWSQGETDAVDGTSTPTYVNEFDTLQKAWKEDYPGFEKTYIFQTRNGGMPYYPFLNLQEIKEAQREVAYENPATMEIMSTSALRQDSGDLHFDYAGGYEIFGDRIFNLIYRDLYGNVPTSEIDAPMITSARFIDSTTFAVVEKADSLIRHNKNLPIQDFEIENAGSASIDSIYLNKNKIIFKLSGYPGDSLTVSYLAQPQDSGNWLTNTNDIEILCFYKYPVNDSVLEKDNNLNEVGSNLKVYPNPFHDNINIEMNISGKYLLELNDLTGRKVEKVEFSGREYELSALGLCSGLYFLRVVDNQNNLIGVRKVTLQ